ncbi:PHP domain-containing protein [Ferrimonas sediminicola]|uniref:PHP domain-containing protein n=1 Tax=Ferrimonas sediminicola TaxID=2569538 RepID=A0A4U1BFR7_9GAMM|nr:PHP domain-containing protein [Ferrimonas sediminicola]TKB49981.1 PHP domain-containing protein [Ferrimonas sediminicola]
MKFDFHSHTTASDGTLTPSELVGRALNQQVDVLAITDHDTTAGLAEAREAAKGRGLTLINGVEISTKWHSFDIHIVGLGFDANNTELQALLDQQRRRRDLRAREMGNRLARKGIPGVWEEAVRKANGATVGRGHFSRVLLERGLVTTQQQAFDKYLGRGKPGYVPNDWCDIATAVSTIQGAGGLAVLAHPGRYQLSNKWLRRLLTLFSEVGGDAMEVVLCQQPQNERSFLGQLCREHRLLASVGSDFHQPGRWVELGRHLQLPDLPGVWQKLCQGQ